MKTSEKLRMLAAVVRRNRRFDVINSDHCITAIGQRLNLETGEVSRSRVAIGEMAKELFADKFGMSSRHVDMLWVGHDANNDKVVKDSKSAKQGAEVIERYAQVYEATGN